ncbi:MAG: DUF1415 family protein [Pseudomonadota bacterium]
MSAPVRPLSSTEAAFREVVRIHERYAAEVVERFDLCPWAARARARGRVRSSVLVGHDPSDLAASLRAIRELEALDEVDIGLVIYPAVGLSRLDFEAFVRRLRAADAERRKPSEAPFAMAAFHPEAALDLSDPDRLVPFLRRSPDPTVQLVRRSVLESIQGRAPEGTSFLDVRLLARNQNLREPRSVRERVLRHNLATVRRVGPATLEAIFADIEADRVRSYARYRELSRPGAG